MENRLKNKKIAILATNGFEKSELFEPKKAIENAGGSVSIISLGSDDIKSWSKGNWNETISVDYTVGNAKPADFDGLMIPGGVINADLLRDNKEAVEFVSAFFKPGELKPVATICHGPWLLVEADVVTGRKMTSYSAISTDLKNAGANWVDEEVVVDNGLTTSRSPNDLEAFCKKMVEEFSEGRHEPKKRSTGTTAQQSQLN